jgi:hypothetical protein
VTDDLEALAAELRSFRPRAPSPALRRRIAARLAGPPALGWTQMRRYAALAASLAAAGLVFAILLDRVGRRHRDPVRNPPLRVAAGDPTPTVRAYRQALAKSPADLDALLDEQARHSAAAGAHARPVRAFMTRDLELLTWIGDR